MNRAKLLRNLLLFFSLVFAMSMGIVLLTRTPAIRIESTTKLAEVDFTRDLGRISADCFTWYPGQLLTPQDFTGQIPISSDESAQFGTYRLMLSLPPEQVYGLTAYSATYAQKLWINGALLSNVGIPGDSLTSMVPKTTHFAIYFTPQTQQTEIIVQRSDFVHAAGGQLYPLYLGPQDRVASMVESLRVSGSIVVGCMLMASLFFLAVFLFFHNRLHFLWFSLASLFIAIRTLSTDHKLIMVFFPGMSWGLSHKLEYAVTGGFVVCFLLYVNRMFALKIPRPAALMGWVLYGLYTALVAVTPGHVYTRFLPLLHYGGIVLALGWLFLLARRMRQSEGLRLERGLVLFGVAAFVAFSVADIIRYQRLDDLNLTQVGMIVFILANTLALILNFTRTEAELARAIIAERELEESNRLLERLNRMKTDYLAMISHEMRTPLTVISGASQLTEWQLEEGKTDAQTIQRLRTASQEAQRLANLAGGLLNVSASRHDIEGFATLSPQALLARARLVIEPILLKHQNRLSVVVQPSCSPVWANEDMLLQVLLNLCVNANQHMKNGSLTIDVREMRGAIRFQVSDSGSGIAPELLPHIFERGISGGGGTGLGLPLCREIIEAHSGSIAIESQAGAGTDVVFTLPKEGAQA